MIRPRDIKNKKFKSDISGYNKKEVNIFLSEVFNDYQEVFLDNERLLDENKALKQKLSEYAKREKAIEEAQAKAKRVIEVTGKCAKDKLEEAQKRALDIIENANSHAETITKNAFSEAGRIIKDAEDEARSRSNDIIDNARAVSEEINNRNDAFMRDYNKMRGRILELLEAETRMIEKSDIYVLKDTESLG